MPLICKLYVTYVHIMQILFRFDTFWAGLFINIFIFNFYGLLHLLRSNFVLMLFPFYVTVIYVDLYNYILAEFMSTL